jgi:hypothetical protein
VPRFLLPAGGLVTGLALTTAGLAGIGGVSAASSSASHYVITRDVDSYSQQMQVVRWPTCITRGGVTREHVIDYKVNTGGHPSHVRMVKHAIAILSRATGLSFHYDGKTTYTPHALVVNGVSVFQALQQHEKTGVDFVVAWARQGVGQDASIMLVGDEAGVGTITWSSSPKFSYEPSQMRITSAAVVIKKGAGGLRPGFGAGGTEGTLLLHELGHAVGMRHTTDPTQVMYPVIGYSSPASYAAGDRTGLAKEGVSRTSLTTPALPPSNHL